MPDPLTISTCRCLQMNRGILTQPYACLREDQLQQFSQADFDLQTEWQAEQAQCQCYQNAGRNTTT